MRVIIIGGGIGGLTAALAFHHFGHEVTVHEKADCLREVGAGIQLSPNAIKPLRALGLESAIKAVASTPVALIMRDGLTGRALFSLPIAERAERHYHAGYHTLHRADMIALLSDALDARVPGAIRLGQELVAVHHTPTGALAEFADASMAEADLIVGADGIHSRVRSAIALTKEARFTGQLAWRATVPVGDAHPLAHTTNVWTAPGRHVVTYGLRGGRLLNIVGVVEDHDWRGESWSQEGSPDAMKADFAGFAAPVVEALSAVRTCFKWALHDRPPLPNWSSGAVTLLGDAVHPMLPFMAQGACMGIEDGYVLARRVTETASLPLALERYQAARLPRTRAVHAVAARNAKVFHLTNPLARLGFGLVTGLADTLFKQALWAQTDWIYAADVTR